MPNTEAIKDLEIKIDDLVMGISSREQARAAEIVDLREDIETLDGRLDAHHDILSSLLQWRDSNGSPGAEERLRGVEKCAVDLTKEKLPERMNSAEADIISLHRIADTAMRAVIEESVNGTLDKRSKTTIERIKAWGPIVSATLAAAALVLAAVL